MDSGRAISRTPSPGPARVPSTPPYRAAVSDDSDDYEQVRSKAQGSSTSTAISHSTDSEGLRERNRTPYSVTSPSAVPKKEDFQPGSLTSDQAPSSSSSTDKGKQKAEEPLESKEADNVENPFACHIWYALSLLHRVEFAIWLMRDMPTPNGDVATRCVSIQPGSTSGRRCGSEQMRVGELSMLYKSGEI